MDFNRRLHEECGKYPHHVQKLFTARYVVMCEPPKAGEVLVWIKLEGDDDARALPILTKPTHYVAQLIALVATAFTIPILSIRGLLFQGLFSISIYN